MNNYVYLTEQELKVLQDMFICKNDMFYQVLEHCSGKWCRIARYNKKNNSIKVMIIPSYELPNFAKY